MSSHLLVVMRHLCMLSNKKYIIQLDILYIYILKNGGYILFFQYILKKFEFFSLSTFFNLLYKTLKILLGKFFWLFDFGHFFCPFLKSKISFVKKRGLCDHNSILWSQYQKNNSKIVIVIFKYF